MIETLTGQLLVASSLVTEPMYAGGVCLVVHQDDENVVGVMLNRPMKPSPAALLELLNQSSDDESGREEPLLSPTEDDLSDSEGVMHAADLSVTFDDSETAVNNRLPSLGNADPTLPNASLAENSPLGMLHFGGPMSGPVVAIHQDLNQAEAETGAGIYVAAQKQHLEKLVHGQQLPYRLIVGHLGWKPEQLQHELAGGVWHRTPATPETVFARPDEMWPSIIRRATSNSMSKWLGIPDAIEAGELN